MIFTKILQRFWNKIWHFKLWIIMELKFVGLRAETYIYLIDDSSEDKKAKDTKNCVIKRKLEFEICKNC